MHRLPTMPLDRPIPASGEREDTEFSSDDAALSHLKLGTAWLCTTLAGVAGLAYASISQTSPPATMLVLVVLLAAYGGYGFSLPKKNTVQFADSFYYMGFLWAIFGLISAFVLLTRYPNLFQTIPMTNRIPLWLTILVISRDVLIVSIALMLNLALQGRSG